MPRFFFNVFGDQDAFDTVGKEFVGLRGVRAHLILKAATICSELDALFQPSSDWEIEALNERGEIVASLSVGMENS